MKNYLTTLLLFFIGLTSYAQMGGMGMNRGMGMGTQRIRNMAPTQNTSKPDFQIEKQLGIVIYDIEKAAKKSKLKINSDEGKQFQSILTMYNRTIRDFRRINSFTLRSTKELVDNYQKQAEESRDFSGFEKIQKQVAESLKDIRETLKSEDIKLDKQIKLLLSDKQYKKWISYNRSIKKFFPKDETK